MIIVKGGVTAPRGFLANGVKAGIKESGKKDLALIYSEVQAVCAASFTTNSFSASPVKVSKDHLKSRFHQAIIVNSGNANCANGRDGDKKAALMAGYIAQTMALEPGEVLVASTGIIGRPLPVSRIERAIPSLVSGVSRSGGGAFAEAIMTTDTVRKEFVVKVKIGHSTVTIGGACKGVGMIYPEMKVARHATLLCFITTDADISKKMLEKALSGAVEESFNMISVDGDMSTNDSCMVMANGLAGNRPIRRAGHDYDLFIGGLKYLATELAKMIARDGEGATKLVEIEVSGAASLSDARRAARKISTSNLLKCCIFGEDPNWGRVVAACGSSGIRIDPDRVDVFLGEIKALSNGTIAKGYDKEKARKYFREKDVKIRVSLKLGRHSAVAWTCDFSKEYVEINSEYST